MNYSLFGRYYEQKNQNYAVSYAEVFEFSSSFILIFLQISLSQSIRCSNEILFRKIEQKKRFIFHHDTKEKKIPE